jgi:DNA-3-methyladenine glycosylase
MKLDPNFYINNNVLTISKALLGKILYTNLDGVHTSGMIVEVEAYHGKSDKACHAFNNRRTARTEIMYHSGGVAYVYLCYGIHQLFNIVTNTEGNADAVLVRALQPMTGIEKMLERRNMIKLEKRITSGPGALSKAMGIDQHLYGASLWGDLIWIEDHGTHVHEKEIVATTRIGVDYAGEDALLPWRFYIKDNPWVSRI